MDGSGCREFYHTAVVFLCLFCQTALEDKAAGGDGHTRVPPADIILGICKLLKVNGLKIHEIVL